MRDAELLAAGRRPWETAAVARVASAPRESIMVVIQFLEAGSGGRRTLVMTPGTTSEKCRDTKVETRQDFPTPSARIYGWNVGESECQ